MCGETEVLHSAAQAGGSEHRPQNRQDRRENARDRANREYNETAREHSQSRIPSQIQRKIRKSNTGCLYQISVNLREGSICPRLSGGKRKKCNVYAKTREQCEGKLAERIEKANAEIAEAKKAANA